MVDRNLEIDVDPYSRFPI